MPREEKYDLVDQMRRASKAVPRLIAEGFAKKHQPRGFIKYIDDVMAESNEMIVCLCYCRDLYPCALEKEVCEKLIDVYDKSSKQLYKLGLAWRKFKDVKPKDERSYALRKR